MVMRTQVMPVEMPPFSRVINRVEVLFTCRNPKGVSRTHLSPFPPLGGHHFRGNSVKKL